MKDKELKRLSRSELLDIVYALRKNQDALEKMNSDLRSQLEAREMKLSEAGSLAEASLAVTRIFEEAQKAADIYLAETRRRNEEAADLLAQATALLDQVKAANVGTNETDISHGHSEHSEESPAPISSGGGAECLSPPSQQTSLLKAEAPPCQPQVSAPQTPSSTMQVSQTPTRQTQAQLLATCQPSNRSMPSVNA